MKMVGVPAPRVASETKDLAHILSDKPRVPLKGHHADAGGVGAASS